MTRILAGELDPDSAEARAAAARDPRLRDELAAMSALEGRLAAVGGEIRAVGAGAAEGEEAAVARFRQHAGVQAQPRGRIWRIALAAAAVIAAVAIGVRLAGDRADPADPSAPRHLGSDSECSAPRGAVRQYGAFAWELALPANARFELVIRATDGREILVVPDLKASTWTPDPAVVAGWPARIHWTVYVVQNGTPGGASCSAEAWLDSSAPR